MPLRSESPLQHVLTPHTGLPGASVESSRPHSLALSLSHFGPVFVLLIHGFYLREAVSHLWVLKPTCLGFNSQPAPASVQELG